MVTVTGIADSFVLFLHRNELVPACASAGWRSVLQWNGNLMREERMRESMLFPTRYFIPGNGAEQSPAKRRVGRIYSE